MFTDEFRRQVELGKYTRWATNLSADELLGLLWALGEYGCRAMVHGEAPQQQLQECAAQSGLHYRACVGLRMALESASGKFRTVEEVKAAIRAAVDANRFEDESK